MEEGDVDDETGHGRQAKAEYTQRDYLKLEMRERTMRRNSRISDRGWEVERSDEG